MSNETNKEPEALRLATILKMGTGYASPSILQLQVSDELVRQHALIAELVEALEMSLDEFNGLPHSLGYNFTHAPKLRALISKAKES